MPFFSCPSLLGKAALSLDSLIDLCCLSGVCAPGLHRESRDWGRGVNAASAAPQNFHPTPCLEHPASHALDLSPLPPPGQRTAQFSHHCGLLEPFIQQGG